MSSRQLGQKFNGSAKRLGAKIEKAGQRLGQKTFVAFGDSHNVLRKIDNTIGELNRNGLAYAPGVNLVSGLAQGSFHAANKLSKKAKDRHSNDMEKYNRRKYIEDKQTSDSEISGGFV